MWFPTRSLTQTAGRLLRPALVMTGRRSHRLARSLAIDPSLDFNRLMSPQSPGSPAASESPPPARSAHVPVMLREVLQILELAPGLTVVDGTLGGAGHSRAILQRIGPTGRLIAQIGRAHV